MRPSLLLACLLAGPPSFAEAKLPVAREPAASVPADAEPTTARPTEADGELHWPLPWAHGGRLAYRHEHTSSRRDRSGAQQEIHATEVVEVATARSSKWEHEQVWTSRDSQWRFSGDTPAETRLMVESLSAALAGKPVRVVLDGEGAANAVANLDELLPEFRSAFSAAMASGLREALAAIADPGERARQEPAMQARFQRLVDMLASPAVLGAQLLELPVAYNFPSGGGLLPGEAYEYEDQSENPLGGKPFPMLGRLQLQPGRDARGHVEMEWELRLHPEKAMPAMIEAVETLIGEALDAEARKALPERLDIAYLTRYRIDPATGVVHWLERTETQRLPGVDKHSTTRLVLLPAPLEAGGDD